MFISCISRLNIVSHNWKQKIPTFISSRCWADVMVNLGRKSHLCLEISPCRNPQSLSKNVFLIAKKVNLNRCQNHCPQSQGSADCRKNFPVA